MLSTNYLKEHIPGFFISNTIGTPLFDPSMWFYILSLLAIILGLVLMMWWLFYKRFNTSFIYKALIMLYFGGFISIGYAVTIRIARHFYPTYTDMLTSTGIFGVHMLPVCIGF